MARTGACSRRQYWSDGPRSYAGDSHLPDPAQDERRGRSVFLGSARELVSASSARLAVAGIVDDWFGPSAIGLRAAAIYGAGMLGCRRRRTFSAKDMTMTDQPEGGRHALPGILIYRQLSLESKKQLASTVCELLYADLWDAVVRPNVGIAGTRRGNLIHSCRGDRAHSHGHGRVRRGQPGGKGWR